MRAQLPRAQTLTVIILTFNEAPHIERCIRSALRVAGDVLVVDSYSTDDTVARARRLNARTLTNPWKNYSTQLNWALASGSVKSDWVMRLDADEYLDEQLIISINAALSSAGHEIGAFELNCQIRFMGQPIRHGGVAPMWLTRVWRNGSARCETRWMDEHIVVSTGQIARLRGLLIHENLRTLSWWTQKHDSYSSREVVDLFDRPYRLGLTQQELASLNRQARVKRWAKTSIYARLPLGIRPWIYFAYRVILRFGLFDGARGMIYHTLQGLWYRLLVDAKALEVQDVMLREGWDAAHAIHHVLGIDITIQNDTPPGHEPI